MGRPGEYTVPQSVRTIGEGAFNGCKLSKIVFNDNLRKIASEAFYGCNGLISVSFPEDLEIIEDAAFMHASNLRSVHINSLTAFPAISEDSFALAGGDLSVYAPDNLIERLEADENGISCALSMPRILLTDWNYCLCKMAMRNGTD